jgi:hypothetical protein
MSKQGISVIAEPFGHELIGGAGEFQFVEAENDSLGERDQKEQHESDNEGRGKQKPA